MPDHRPRRRAVRLAVVLALAAVALGALGGALATLVAGDVAVAAPDPIGAPTGTPTTPTPPTIPPIPDIPRPVGPAVPNSPIGPSTPVDQRTADDAPGSATIGIDVPDVTGDSSNAVVIILLLSVLSIAPSLLILTTSFTRIVIVMSLTRNALGIPQLPPQQVIVGLSLFLTLFVMGPTLSEMNESALQPLMANELSFTEAADAAAGPLREFMFDYTREQELELFLDASSTATPVTRDEVPLTALVPAFVLSELKSAFILGFIIFVPFMVLDLVVSAVLTSLGMMMLPPTFVSLPLKLLLFILLDGWTLIIGTLLTSYQ
jgi:flagellar biosynthetic protein FliP